MAATVSITRCWLVALSLLLVGCGGDPQGSSIRAARLSDTQLQLDLDLRFTATQLDAVDQGIPLQLAITGAGTERRIIELRYRPLARQYEWRFLDESAPRLYASRARLLAALDRIVIDDVRADAGKVRVALVSSALPAPLRLPALVDARWQLATPAHEWRR